VKTVPQRRPSCRRLRQQRLRLLARHGRRGAPGNETQNIDGVEGIAITNVLVATFTDTGGATGGDYAAAINWDAGILGAPPFTARATPSL
jgi:hypothetical protein